MSIKHGTETLPENQWAVKAGASIATSVRHGSQNVWALQGYAFGVTITTPQAIASAVFYRVDSPMAGASLQQIMAGDTVYDGDVIAMYVTNASPSVSYGEWDIASVASPHYYQNDASGGLVIRNPNAFAVNFIGIGDTPISFTADQSKAVQGTPATMYTGAFATNRSRQVFTTNPSHALSAQGMTAVAHYADEDYTFAVIGTPSVLIQGSQPTTTTYETEAIVSAVTNIYCTKPLTITICKDAGDFRRHIGIENENPWSVSYRYTTYKDTEANIRNWSVSESIAISLNTIQYQVVEDRAGFDDAFIGVNTLTSVWGYSSGYSYRLITYCSEEVVFGRPTNYHYLLKQSIPTYTVTFSLGNYVTSGFVSISDSATSGSASGVIVPRGTEIYYYVEIEQDTAQYAYSCSGTLISGRIYRLGATIVTGNVNLGALSGVTRTLRSYTLTLSKGTGINRLYYRLGTSGSYTEWTSGTVSVPYGTTVQWYATPQTGYSSAGLGSSGSPNSVTMGGDLSIAPSATKLSYAVTMSAGTGVSQVYSATSSTATSGNASGHTYEYGTTVYIFAKMQSGYIISGGTLISGTAGSANAIYRVASRTVTSAWAYGTVNGTSSAGSWHTEFSGNLYFGIPDDYQSSTYEGEWHSRTVHSCQRIRVSGGVVGFDADYGGLVFDVSNIATVANSQTETVAEAYDYPNNGFIWSLLTASLYSGTNVSLGANIWLTSEYLQYGGVYVTMIESFY